MTRQLPAVAAVVWGSAAILFAEVGCHGLKPPAPPAVPAEQAQALVPANPKFDEAWRSLGARAGVAAEVFYIEDDRGEGLMGRVRRAARAVPKPAPPPENEAPPTHTGDPEVPDGEEVSSVVRANLPSIKACYLRMTRAGTLISGRAIINFTVDKTGSVGNVLVDAPVFRDTDLPRCVSQQVARWAFPKSRRGGLAVSYPFVFVGG